MNSQLNDSDLEGFARRVAISARQALEAKDQAWVYLPSFEEEVTAQALTILKTVVPAACDHDFSGGRQIDGGRGWERVCAKCGIGAMEHNLRNNPL